MTEQEKAINERFFEAGFNGGWKTAISSREPLYRAINAMMAHLGAHGEIDTRSPLVTAVMDALHDVDGGVYQPASREPMPLEKAEELAHRIASKYTHKSDRKFTAYTFLPHTLEEFVRAVENHHRIVKPA